MVVDAGGPGAALDQLAYGDAYGDAYGKALSEGIAVLGGFGGRDDLGDVHPGAPRGSSAASPGEASGRRFDEFHGPVEPRDLRGVPAVDFDGVFAGARDREVPAIVAATGPSRPAGADARLLGDYTRASLAEMPTRELRRRYCDVFEAPPPAKRLEDAPWLRARLAPHALDALDPGGGALEDRYATDEEDRETTRGGESTVDRPEGVPESSGMPSSGMPSSEAPTPAPTPSPFPFAFVRDGDFDGGYAPAPRAFLPAAVEGSPRSPPDQNTKRGGVPSLVESLLSPDRPSPSAASVAARVARAAPRIGDEWALTAAAAAAAAANAAEKLRVAVEARARGVRLAAFAHKAVVRATRSAEKAAGIAAGDVAPAPASRVPAAIFRRLALTGRTDNPRPAKRRKPSASTPGGDAFDRRGIRASEKASSARGTLPEGDAGLAAAAAAAAPEAFRHPSPPLSRTSDAAPPAAAAPSPDPDPDPDPAPPPRPKMDLSDPASRRRAAMWRRAATMDACHACGEEESREGDEIIFCDGCDVQTHLSCYGLAAVPEGRWLCVGCEDGVVTGDATEGDVGVCALCPQPGGALARVDPPSRWDVQWESPGHYAHLACAECLPEVFVHRAATVDEAGNPLPDQVPGTPARRPGDAPTIDMSFVKAARINLTCGLCGQEGACTQCAMRKCFASFHPLCARAEGFATETHAGEGGRPLYFCKTHSGERWAEQRLASAGKKSAVKPAREGRGKREKHQRDGAAKRRSPGSPDADDAVRNAVTGGPEGTPSAPAEASSGESSPGRLLASRARCAARLWEGALAPFVRSPRDRARRGRLLRKILDETAGTAARHFPDAERKALVEMDGFAAGEAAHEAALLESGGVLGGGAGFSADAAALGFFPPALAASQRRVALRLSALHLAGLGGIVSDPVGSGKRLAVLAHLAHLKDALKLPGPHLLAAAPDRARSWIADANAHFPRLRVVSLARGAADDDLRAKRAAIRQGAVDVVIVAADALVASATERASAARERARRAEDEKSRGAAAPSEEKIGAARVAKDQEEAREDEADGTPATCDGEADDAEATAAKEREQPSFPSSSDAADLATAGSDDAVAAAPAPRGGKQRPRSKKKGAVGQKKASSDKSGGTRTRPGFLPAHALETTFRCLIVDADDGGGDPRGGPSRSILPALASAAVRETIAYSRLVLVGSSVVPRRVTRVGAGVGAPPADAYASFRAALALLLPEAFAAADRANAEEAALTARTAEAGDDFSREASSEAAADPSAAISATTSPRAFWDEATFSNAFAPPSGSARTRDAPGDRLLRAAAALTAGSGPAADFDSRAFDSDDDRASRGRLGLAPHFSTDLLVPFPSDESFEMYKDRADEAGARAAAGDSAGAASALRRARDACDFLDPVGAKMDALACLVRRIKSRGLATCVVSECEEALEAAAAVFADAKVAHARLDDRRAGAAQHAVARFGGGGVPSGVGGGASAEEETKSGSDVYASPPPLLALLCSTRRFASAATGAVARRADALVSLDVGLDPTPLEDATRRLLGVARAAGGGDVKKPLSVVRFLLEGSLEESLASEAVAPCAATSVDARTLALAADAARRAAAPGDRAWARVALPLRESEGAAAGEKGQDAGEEGGAAGTAAIGRPFFPRVPRVATIDVGHESRGGGGGGGGNGGVLPGAAVEAADGGGALADGGAFFDDGDIGGDGFPRGDGFAPGGSLSPAAKSSDKARFDASEALAMERARRSDSDPVAYRASACAFCGGVGAGACARMPPAFVAPDVAGKRLACALCPAVASFGCARVTQTPRRGWVCPQHRCHACGRPARDARRFAGPEQLGGVRVLEEEGEEGDAAYNACVFRCVSCLGAFCDECSGGASFEALERHPGGWEERGFVLAKGAYEYVRCQTCVRAAAEAGSGGHPAA